MAYNELDNKGKTFYRLRGDRVSARTINTERRKTVPVNGLSSLDGLPVGTQDRRKDKKWERRINNMKFVKNHPISVPYWCVTIIVGAWLQGWIHLGF